MIDCPCAAQGGRREGAREDQKGLDSAWAGNRTRASRVAGENSTTEPPMQMSYRFVTSLCEPVRGRVDLALTFRCGKRLYRMIEVGGAPGHSFSSSDPATGP